MTTTITAIYKNGVFQPTQPLTLSEDSQVILQVDAKSSQSAHSTRATDEIHKMMSLRFSSGQRDLAERHNEHQP